MASPPEALTAADPLELGRLRDPHGVLSLYVDADPHEQAATRPAWIVEAENGLRAIRDRAKASGDRALWTALFERLDELEPEISTLLDPRHAGRGRALFATVGGGDVRTVWLRVPLVNRVVLDDGADLMPLLAALDRGRPVGVIAVSHPELRVFEHRLGVVEEVQSLSLEPDTSEWREMKGPAAANPALAQHSAPQRDRFERRLEEHRIRALEAAAGVLESAASSRGWEHVLVAGDRQLADRLVVVFGRLDVTTIGRSLHGLGPTEIAEVLGPELESAQLRRELGLVERARDAALSGSAGALGLADVLAALEDGRVGHLLLAADRDYPGARTTDGRLAPAGIVPPGVEPDELAPLPSLVGHVVERALAIDAQVTPLTPTGADVIAEHDGIAALLRW